MKWCKISGMHCKKRSKRNTYRRSVEHACLPSIELGKKIKKIIRIENAGRAYIGESSPTDTHTPGVLTAVAGRERRDARDAQRTLMSGRDRWDHVGPSLSRCFPWVWVLFWCGFLVTARIEHDDRFDDSFNCILLRLFPLCATRQINNRKRGGNKSQNKMVTSFHAEACTVIIASNFIGIVQCLSVSSNVHLLLIMISKWFDVAVDEKSVRISWLKWFYFIHYIYTSGDFAALPSIENELYNVNKVIYGCMSPGYRSMHECPTDRHTHTPNMN